MVKKKTHKHKTKKTSASSSRHKTTNRRRILKKHLILNSKTPNKDIMEDFTIDTIPDLDVCVLGALELFQDSEIPKIDIPYKTPLVVGSGNAEATGRILFEEMDAIFASESNFEEKLKNIKSIDGVILISASGGKHAPMITRVSQKYKKHVTLLTTNYHSKAEKLLDHKHKDDLFIFPHQREPYTYNTSTYLSMILGKTNENPEKIYEYIKYNLDQIKLPKFEKYKKFYLIVPPKFSGIKRMLQVKFIELFGREIARDIETSEYVRHATTIVPSDELFISFGERNNTFGLPKQRLFIPLPKNADYGAMMAISYYIIGKIQGSQPAYFKRYIKAYTNQISKIFGQRIKPIVP
mgnify:CR=1 FL=1|jgi:hypothetical protein